MTIPCERKDVCTHRCVHRVRHIVQHRQIQGQKAVAARHVVQMLGIDARSGIRTAVQLVWKVVLHDGHHQRGIRREKDVQIQRDNTVNSVRSNEGLRINARCHIQTVVPHIREGTLTNRRIQTDCHIVQHRQHQCHDTVATHRIGQRLRVGAWQEVSAVI